MKHRVLCSGSILFAVLASALLAGKTPEKKVVLYASVGTGLIQYDFDPGKATLIQRGSVTLPANIQEAWAHPSRKYLYVAWSNGGASYTPDGRGTPKGDMHGMSVFRIDPVSGALLPDGKPVSFSSRPIFVTTDIDGTHLLVAHNEPSELTVHRILPDGSIGAQVPSPAPLDFGIFAHQVRMDPSNKTVILVTRGIGPTATKPEDPARHPDFQLRKRRSWQAGSKLR